MTDIPMPEPVAYPTDEWVDEFFGNPDETGFYSFRGDFGNIAYRFQLAAQAGDFITTTQAEAYAEARVREALEEAAKICDARAMKNEAAVSADEPDEASSLRAAAWQMGVCARDIRALIK